MYLFPPEYSARRLHPRAALEIALLAVAILLASAGFVRVIPAFVQFQPQVDFGAYYVAARVLNAGASPYQPEVMRNMALDAGNVPQMGYLYPPFFAVLLRPLALLPFPTAEKVWLGLNIFFYAMSILILGRFFRLRTGLLILSLVVGVLLPAVYDTLLLGQVSLLLTLLLAGALASSASEPRRQRDAVLAGILLGLAIVIKLYPAVLGLVYLIHRRTATLIATAITVAMAMLFGILYGGGWENTVRWFSDVLPAIPGDSFYPTNQSLYGVTQRLFTFSQFKVPVLTRENYVPVILTPPVNNPALGEIIFYAGGLVFLVIAVRYSLANSQGSENRTGFLFSFALGVVTMLLVTLRVWDTYFTNLLIPVFVLGYYGRGIPSLRTWLIVACLLLVLQRYWRYLLLYIQTPGLTVFGFLGLLALWLALLQLPRILEKGTRGIKDDMLATSPGVTRR